MNVFMNSYGYILYHYLHVFDIDKINACPVSKRPLKVYKGGIYGYIRHPMMTSLMCSICITPTMVSVHLYCKCTCVCGLCRMMSVCENIWMTHERQEHQKLIALEAQAHTHMHALYTHTHKPTYTQAHTYTYTQTHTFGT